MNKNIVPYNKEGKRHGYWEIYRENGKIWYKGYHDNGKVVGYWERYNENGKLMYKGYSDNGERVGYWEHYGYWFIINEIKIYI